MAKRISETEADIVDAFFEATADGVSAILADGDPRARAVAFTKIKEARMWTYESLREAPPTAEETGE